jgi:hypothetical protein
MGRSGQVIPIALNEQDQATSPREASGIILAGLYEEIATEETEEASW